ncbi:MAG: Pr6Pr family membrane protein [Thermomonas sp.]
MRARFAAGTLAALAWTALALQLFLTLRLSLANGNGLAHGAWIFLAYFTVLSNLFVAIVATLASARADGGIDLRWRGCAVTAIALVGLGYHLLLSKSVQLHGPDRVADLLLHYAVPLAALGWWLLFPPRGRIAATAPWRWLAWPAVYAAYALARGAMTGFYPYPFIDVAALGAVRVALNVAALALAFLLVGYALRWSANARVRSPR